MQTLIPAEAARAGAEWLDELYPGWHRHINRNSLDVEDDNNCICAQLQRVLGVSHPETSPYNEFVAFHLGVPAEKLGASLENCHKAICFAAPLGFAYDSRRCVPEEEEWWAGLDASWRKMIRERLARDAHEQDDTLEMMIDAFEQGVQEGKAAVA